jgi:predicted ArsR family transcriptional regulator
LHAVRRHILEILKQRNGATVADLADALEMAPVSVRHHLDLLQSDNLIRVERLERSGAVGRPQQVYALTVEAAEYFPNNFTALAGNLVRQVKQVLPEGAVEAIFCSMALELASEFDRSGLEHSTPAEQLERIAEYLNARGYLASWNTGLDDGVYLIHKHNCPYAGVSEVHSELCRMDQTLVDTLVGQPCERISHMGSDDHCCTYQVRLDSEKTWEGIPLQAVLSSNIALIA